jgi:hypothetical protein
VGVEVPGQEVREAPVFGAEFAVGDDVLRLGSVVCIGRVEPDDLLFRVIAEQDDRVVDVLDEVVAAG